MTYFTLLSFRVWDGTLEKMMQFVAPVWMAMLLQEGDKPLRDSACDAIVSAFRASTTTEASCRALVFQLGAAIASPASSKITVDTLLRRGGAFIFYIGCVSR